MNEGTNKIDMDKFISGLLHKKSIDEEKQTYSDLDKLRDELKLTKNLITPGLPFRIGTTQHAEGKAPYAIIQIDNDYYTARFTEDDGIFIKDFPKGSGKDFHGFSEELAQTIDATYSIFAHMNEDGDKSTNTAHGDLNQSDKEKEDTLNKVLGDLNILGKDYAKNKHDKIHGHSAMNEWDEEDEGPQPGDMEYHSQNLRGIEEQMGEEFTEKDIDDYHFNIKSLYHYLKDAFYYLDSYDEAVSAQILESTLKRDYGFTGQKINKSIKEENKKASKINRPIDAEGNPITLKARVEDVNTGTIGRVQRFGVDDNGNLTVHVIWNYTFGDAIVKPVVYPNKIIVKDDQRVVKEDEIEEGIGHSHTIGRGENEKSGNYPQTLKRVGINENLDFSFKEKESIPEILHEFLVANSFNLSKPDSNGNIECNYTLNIPKQADETQKSIEYFINEEESSSIYKKVELYTEINKNKNMWIIKVNRVHNI